MLMSKSVRFSKGKATPTRFSVREATCSDRSQTTLTSILHHINPLLKVVVCLSITIVALPLHQINALALLVCSLLLLSLTTVRLPLKVWGYLAIVLTIGVLLAALLRDRDIAILSVLRLLAIALPAPLLASNTAPSDLVRALQAVRLPGFLVLSIMLIWRFMPLMQQEVHRIIEANQLRGVNLTRQPRQWFSGLFLPLIFRMVAYADEVTIGLETRGYDPIAPRSNSHPLKWRTADTLFAVGAVVLLGTVGYIEWIA
jgi:energy-coupling factor transport system permease protein